jgi:hypothetical protein
MNVGGRYDDGTPARDDASDQCPFRFSELLAFHKKVNFSEVVSGVSISGSLSTSRDPRRTNHTCFHKLDTAIITTAQMVILRIQLKDIQF